MNEGKNYVIADGQFYFRNGDRFGVIPVQVLHNYWKCPDAENAPKDYEDCPERTEKLVGLFSKYCEKTDSILEIGCGIGRNLNALFNNGFTKLEGVDINTKALQLGREIYPKTVGAIPLYNYSIEDYLIFSAGKKFDVIFSMGVMMHLHPSSQWVFKCVADNAKKYIITAEDERYASYRAIPRNYKDIFEEYDFKQVYEDYVDYDNNIDDTGRVSLMYRVLKNEA
jgi:SAM-dependent methyltransferase